jgi:hypothetical protein
MRERWDDKPLLLLKSGTLPHIPERTWTAPIHYMNESAVKEYDVCELIVPLAVMDIHERLQRTVIHSSGEGHYKVGRVDTGVCPAGQLYVCTLAGTESHTRSGSLRRAW